MTDAGRLSFVFSSLVELPSFDKVEPRYLKLSTSSRFCPFSVMEVAACYSSYLLFSELTTIPYAPAVLSRLVVRSRSSVSLAPMRSMSSAKSRLRSGRMSFDGNGNGGVEVMEGQQHDFLQIDVKQNWR